MTSFSQRESKDLLKTQKFTLCQMVNFLYNMDIYDTNVENNDDSLLKYYVIITLQNRIKTLDFTQLSQHTR